MSRMQYGLLGGKLGHSLSPKIHELFFRHTGKEGSYVLLETPEAGLPERLRQLRSEGYAGCNVTIPHKVAVMPLLDGVAKEAAAIGAVNTIHFTGQGAFGYNTDYFGFGRMLEYNGIDVAGKTAVVLGSGGAARAVLSYLKAQQAAELYLVTRSPEKVDAYFYQIAPQLRVIGYDELAKLSGRLLVNCTPVGMYPAVEACPVNAGISAAFDASVDLIYNPAQTLFLRQAAAAGKKAVNGLFMLVAQAVAAQEIWQQETYDSRLIEKIMTELENCL